MINNRTEASAQRWAGEAPRVSVARDGRNRAPVGRLRREVANVAKRRFGVGEVGPVVAVRGLELLLIAVGQSVDLEGRQGLFPLGGGDGTAQRRVFRIVGRAVDRVVLGH